MSRGSSFFFFFLKSSYSILPFPESLFNPCSPAKVENGFNLPRIKVNRRLACHLLGSHVLDESVIQCWIKTLFLISVHFYPHPGQARGGRQGRGRTCRPSPGVMSQANPSNSLRGRRLSLLDYMHSNAGMYGLRQGEIRHWGGRREEGAGRVP